jgi:hypothetical protein
MDILRTLKNATVYMNRNMKKKAKKLKENQERKSSFPPTIRPEYVRASAQNHRAPTEHEYVSIIKCLSASFLPPCTADVILCAKPFRRYLYSTWRQSNIWFEIRLVLFTRGVHPDKVELVGGVELCLRGTDQMEKAPRPPKGCMFRNKRGLHYKMRPVKVAARSKAWNVFARLNTGIVGSNPARDIDVCVYSVFVLSCVGSRLATGWSLVQGVLPTVYKCKIKEPH